MKFYTLLFVVISINAFGQSPLTISRPLDSLPLKAERFVGRDQFANLYFINNNIFTKVQVNRSLEYKNIAKGKLTYVDIQNPLLILLFYKDFNSVVLLDDQLNEIRQINFNENTDFPVQAHAAGIASQNRIWIYDSLKQQLFLFDYKQNSFQALATSFPGNILHFESDFNEFRWVDENRNAFACDVYGKIATLGKVPEFEDCEIVSHTQFLYKVNGKLYLYSFIDVRSTLIELDKNSFNSFYYKDQILSIFTKRGITNYKISLP